MKNVYEVGFAHAATLTEFQRRLAGKLSITLSKFMVSDGDFTVIDLEKAFENLMLVCKTMLEDAE